MRGNIVELAIAFVLGGAFATIVNSMVDNIILPIVAAIFGQPSFNGLSINIGESAIAYGAFLDDILAFALLALGLFVFVVKPFQAAEARRATEEEVAPTADAEDTVLLREIRDALNK
jgi:large conductance mechanosensitive channel